MTTAYLTMLRPSQWFKNLLMFFPPLLAGKLLLPGLFISGLIPFCAFCLVSSAGYIFNDLLDRKRDLYHPQKSLRSIPSGDVSLLGASIFSIFLLVGGLMLTSLVSYHFLLLLAGYAVVSTSYSLLLKKIPLVDILCISSGFLLRLQAGGEIFQIQISSWLFLTVFLLSIFLSTGKRLSESGSLGDAAGDHRKSLSQYPPGFLAGTIYVTGCSVLVTYAMYALTRPELFYTIPICMFGLLRYILRISSGKGGDPTESLLKDRILSVVSIMWMSVVLWSIYL